MAKLIAFIYIVFFTCVLHSQPISEKKSSSKQDTIKKKEFLKQLGNGYFPTKYFNFDLKYLIKYNQYEALRTGLGGITNDHFSEKLKLNSYVVYGFRDHRFKYSVGASLRVGEKTKTWLNASFTDDLQESGSSVFLTDKRLFQLFEPRLLNISLFHKHTTSAFSVEHEFSPNLQTETQLATSDIAPTYNYSFLINGKSYDSFRVSTIKASILWSPLDTYQLINNTYKIKTNTYPKFTLQYTKSINGLIDGDFNFSKIDFRGIYQIEHANKSLSELTIVSGLTNGETPLTHLYHAYPNNINKATIMQRFSVAGISSFETMFFNEFFSDRLVTAQLKYFFNPFNMSPRFRPQLVIISRYAIGDVKHTERHQNITFNALNKGYTESGFELNKLFFGFGLSFTYRYGAYHLPAIGDNVAFKFTFNVTL